MREKHDFKELGPHPIDRYVGARLKARRVLLGITQTRVGNALGLTFQQIQKYERGLNRIGSSRLFEISKLLKVPVAYFFEGAEEEFKKNRGVEKTKKDDAAILEFHEDTKDPYKNEDPMFKRETLDLIRVYYSITDLEVRKGILNLCRSLAGSTKVEGNGAGQRKSGP